MIKKAPLGCLAILFSFLLCVSAAAQRPDRPPRQPNPQPTPGPPQPADPGAAPCPTVTVTSQPMGAPVRDGQRIIFAANFNNGGDPKGTIPTIVWNTSAGSVTQGQGTGRIEVDSTGAGDTSDREIKAEVWISGYGPDCIIQASTTVKVIAPAKKFGDFGEVSPETLAANIKSLAEFMAQSPDDLHLIAYAGRNSERGFTQSWVKRIKDGLTAAGVPQARVYATDGGFREQPLFDFWIVPNGAEPPRPAPTVKRTEIVYPKTTPVKKP